MKLQTLDVPEDTSQLSAWLERHLVGDELAGLAAELAVVHEAKSEPATPLAEVLGDRRESVLQSGLSGLPPAAISKLLVEPRLLLDLQAEILVAGGEYWDTLADQTPGELDAVALHGRDRLSGFLDANDPSPMPTSAPQRRPAWYARPAVVSLATAACVLLGVFVVSQFVPIGQEGDGPRNVAQAPVSTGWGWSKPDALPQDVTAEQYLRQLADGAAAWFKKRPTERAALAKRIGEFRQGCSVVMLAEHRPLSDADRVWLIQRCRAWAEKLDGHLADAESPDIELQSARDAADTTINKLIAALNQRADEVASG